MNKILKPRSGCVYMWSLCQNISGLSFQPCFTCPEIWSSHGNGNRKRFFFFKLMKKSVLFWQNKSFYCSKVWLPNNIWLLWKCMRWNRMTFVNKLRKTKSGKIIKNNYCFTQCILQMAATNRNLCYFVVWAHGKVIDTLSFGDIMWKDIKEKLIDFYKDFYLRNFFRK